MATSAAALRSIRMIRLAPRLNASIPTALLPAYASRNTVPAIRGAITLKSVSRRRSGVGRTAVPATVFSFRLRNCPAITRISADLHETVSALPMFPNVVNDGPEFLAITALNHLRCLRARHLQYIGIA